MPFRWVFQSRFKLLIRIESNATDVSEPPMNEKGRGRIRSMLEGAARLLIRMTGRQFCQCLSCVVSHPRGACWLNFICWIVSFG